LGAQEPSPVDREAHKLWPVQTFAVGVLTSMLAVDEAQKAQERMCDCM